MLHRFETDIDFAICCKTDKLDLTITNVNTTSRIENISEMPLRMLKRANLK